MYKNLQEVCSMKPKEVLQILKEAGWHETKGSRHAISVSNDAGYVIPISNHPAKDIPTGTLKKIERLTGVKLK